MVGLHFAGRQRKCKVFEGIRSVMNALDVSGSFNTARDQAVEFEPHELFFSRTDSRGVILSGNEVFHRVARYEWDEMLGAPHKIIRHPDMPKAVFWLLWDTIKKGRPIGAYVKNRAKDGSYYWVFAIVTPLKNEYLSVRLKPTSPLLQVVIAEYKKLVALEKEKGFSPEESAGVLLARLKELGFEDYLSFMATALTNEVDSRNEVLRRKADVQIRHFRKMSESAKEILKEARSVAASYNKNQFVAFNMRIQSARMERGGKPIGVISSDYSSLTGTISEQVHTFIDNAKEVYDTINKSIFLQGTATIQREAIEQFNQETELPPEIDKEGESEVLSVQRDHYTSAAKLSLTHIADHVRMFARNNDEMRRIIAGQEVTRIMGKIECAHVREYSAGLNGVLSDLEVFQKNITDSLKKIEDLNDSLAFHTEKLLDPHQMKLAAR